MPKKTSGTVLGPPPSGGQSLPGAATGSPPGRIARRTPAAGVAALSATVLALFSANSLLARAALGAGLSDAATFTAVRLATGALTLFALSVVLRRAAPRGGGFGAGLALFVYAAAFSLAYRRIGAGPGALLLFAAVQATMVGWSVRAGARPTRQQWIGLFLALAGLAYLTLPGARAPDALGSALMIVAGIAWGAYSLLGRGAVDPLATTAANFARTLVFAVPFLLLWGRGLHASGAGLALATASGAIASGLGYSLWYAVLPALGTTRAAVVQLAVPVLTPLAAAVLLAEPPTPRLVAAGAAIVLGIGLAVSRAGAARRGNGGA